MIAIDVSGSSHILNPTLMCQESNIVNKNQIWHFGKSNARDTTNFTTKYLQTDMASYIDITHQQLYIVICKFYFLDELLLFVT